MHAARSTQRSRRYLATPPMPPEAMFDHLYAALPAACWRAAALPPSRGERRCAEITLVDAVNLALARAMSEDERVVVLGEDVGATAACSARRTGCSTASARSA